MTIGVWGDSITYGSCDSEGLGWVGRLRKSLKNDDDHHLYNFGICGETSRDLCKRFSIEATAVKPDVVIIAVGLNDTKYQGESTSNLVSKEEYITNIQTLIIETQKYTDRIYLVGLTRVDEEWRLAKGSRFLNEDIEVYNQLLTDFASQNNIVYISMLEVLDSGTDLADGLHPNAKGYQKMVETIMNNISLL